MTTNQNNSIQEDSIANQTGLQIGIKAASMTGLATVESARIGKTCKAGLVNALPSGPRFPLPRGQVDDRSWNQEPQTVRIMMKA